jgi:hypothetical protein
MYVNMAQYVCQLVKEENVGGVGGGGGGIGA